MAATPEYYFIPFIFQSATSQVAREGQITYGASNPADAPIPGGSLNSAKSHWTDPNNAVGLGDPYSIANWIWNDLPDGTYNYDQTSSHFLLGDDAIPMPIADINGPIYGPFFSIFYPDFYNWFQHWQANGAFQCDYIESWPIDSLEGITGMEIVIYGQGDKVGGSWVQPLNEEGIINSWKPSVNWADFNDYVFGGNYDISKVVYTGSNAIGLWELGGPTDKFSASDQKFTVSWGIPKSLNSIMLDLVNFKFGARVGSLQGGFNAYFVMLKVFFKLRFDTDNYLLWDDPDCPPPVTPNNRRQIIIL